MRFKSITPLNVGPFDERAGAAIPLDDEVTVLTGANDTGKTFLLRILELLGQSENRLTESELADLVNRPFAARTPGWISKSQVGCDVILEGTEAGKRLIPELAPGNKVHVSFRFQPGHVSATRIRIDTPTGPISQGAAFGIRPATVWLPQSDPLRERIAFSSPNATEARLLRLAFGASYQELPRRSNGARSSAIRKAEEALNARLSQLLGPRASLRFALGDGTENFTVNLRDVDGELTPLTWRGAGVRALMGHLVALLEAAINDKPTLVLFDEPELHLHADFQHALRVLLQRTGALEHVQVIYATHSSSMISNRHPERVRVFRKAVGGDCTTVEVEMQPFKQNWLAVREGLGLTAADSLLYSDITIVVEGDSDYLAISEMIMKLSQAQAPGFDKADSLLDRVHFLPGEGSSAPYFVRLAKSQKNRVIVFLDGDKADVAAAIRKEFTGSVPVILLDERSELEDLVARDHYFEALAGELEPGVTPPRITASAFEAWERSATGLTDQYFSKRVALWLRSSLNIKTFPKAAVMAAAVGRAKAADLQSAVGPLRKLLAAIEEIDPQGRAAPSPGLVASVSGPPVAAPPGQSPAEHRSLVALRDQMNSIEELMAEQERRGEYDAPGTLGRFDALRPVAGFCAPLLARLSGKEERMIREWIRDAAIGETPNAAWTDLKSTVEAVLTSASKS